MMRRRLSNLPWPLIVPFLTLCGMVALLRFTHAEEEASPSAAGEEERSALSENQQFLLQAVESSDWKTAAELLREGESPNLRRPILLPRSGKPDSDPRMRYQGDPLLKVAVLAREESIARLLLKHGADVNAVGRFGYTPLMAAASINEPALVKLLLERGANPNAVGAPRQESALHIVLSRPRNYRFSAFSPFQRTDSPYLKDGAPQRELKSRSERERRIDTVKLLLAAGADPNQKDRHGQTPADEAHRQRDAELEKLLSAAKFTRSVALTKGAGR